MLRATVVISRSLDAEGAWELESSLAGLCAATPELSVLLVPHLYHLPKNSSVWQTLAALEGRVIVFTWLHPRPAEWLMRAHELTVKSEDVLSLAQFATAEAAHQAALDLLGNEGAEGEALEEKDDVDAETAAAGTLNELAEPVAARWYPVLDTARCRNCQNCLQFCLFGVYELNAAGKVMVTNPDSCKAGCPACSRICPAGAIIFPLYAKDEAIAGAPGRLMAPDAAARKMFYTRTRKTCPVCGSTPEAPGQGTGKAGVCEECGRAVVEKMKTEPPVPGKATDSIAPIIKDDIDALLDDLDSLTRGTGA